MSRTVNVHPYLKGVLSWRAETLDDSGLRATGYGYTKRGAIRDLRHYVERRRARERVRNVPPVETIEVDW